MEGDEPVGLFEGELLQDAGTEVATAGGEAVIAELFHDGHGRGRDGTDIEASSGWAVAEAVAGQRHRDDVEGLLGAGEEGNYRQHLDERAGPTVQEEQGQPVTRRCFFVDRVDTKPVDVDLHVAEPPHRWSGRRFDGHRRVLSTMAVRPVELR